MNVSSELKQQVQEQVNSTVEAIERLYRTKFHKPVTIRYDIDSSRLGGQALLNSFVVRLNPVFLNKYTDKYIKSTVVHEVAHLGVQQVYTLDQGRWKVGAHGSEWKNMMVRLGADPSRCHSYEAEEGQGRQKTKYAYVCGCCNKPIPVGPKVHANIQRGRIYTTKCCKTKLVFKGIIGAVPRSIAVERIAANELQPKVEVKQSITKQTAPNPTSKLGICYAAYKKYQYNKYTRKEWISVFVSLGCTPAGASTYYSTCVKLFEQGI
jgi:SprT protein